MPSPALGQVEASAGISLANMAEVGGQHVVHRVNGKGEVLSMFL